MEYSQTFTGIVKFDESDKDKLHELVFKSQTVTIVERKNGFMEIYTKDGVNYTTEDIIRKGL